MRPRPPADHDPASPTTEEAEAYNRKVDRVFQWLTVLVMIAFLFYLSYIYFMDRWRF